MEACLAWEWHALAWRLTKEGATIPKVARTTLGCVAPSQERSDWRSRRGPGPVIIQGPVTVKLRASSQGSPRSGERARPGYRTSCATNVGKEKKCEGGAKRGTSAWIPPSGVSSPQGSVSDPWRVPGEGTAGPYDPLHRDQ